MFYSIPWKAWYGPEMLDIDFLNGWEVEVLNMEDSHRLSDIEISDAISKPYGSKPLEKLAQGKKTAVIAVDDLSRPTEVRRIIPVVTDKLIAAGIKPKNILILIALGGHPAMHRFDLIRKFGEEIVQNFTIYNHSPFYNLVSLGKTSFNTPVYINKFFAEREIKIGIGAIVPHPNSGFGGGGKIVLPGVAGAETTLKNHTRTLNGGAGELIEVEHNNHRADIEEAARLSGLNFIVNQVCNIQGQAAGIFAGDLLTAHREGVKFACQIYATTSPKQILDVAIVNSFPMDTNLIQIIKGLNVFRPGFENLIKPDGSIVLVGACPEGRGYHYFCDYHLPLWHTIEKNTHIGNVIGKRQLTILSPYINQQDVDDFYPNGTRLCKNWAEVRSNLQKRHQGKVRVGIFPSGCLQILE